MSSAVTSSQIQQWQQELESIGRVDIESDFSGLTWRVALALLLAGGIIYARYLAGDLSQQVFLYALAGLVLFIGVLVIAVRTYWGGKSVIIERDSVVITDGSRISWADVTDVTVFNMHNSGPAVQINLTEDAWADYLANQGRGGNILHRANKMVTRNRGLVLPQYLQGSPEELAAWMNRFSRGEKIE